MKFICNFLLMLNYIAYILADVCAWSVETKYGILFLLPLLLFPIIIILAKKVVISKADKFFKSEWQIFSKEVKWGNSVTFFILAIIYWALYT